MQKGVSPLLAAVFTVAMAITLAAFVGGWLTNFSSERSERLENTTKSQLECQFADIFIRNATYNCSSDCAAGVAHNLTVTVVNSGKLKVALNNLVVENSTGDIFTFGINSTAIDVGSVATIESVHNTSCSGINRTVEKIIINSPTCPTTAYDSIDGDQVVFLSC